ncbi:MAG: nucleotidyltransferase domain-containing protein [Candidatus Magasanikbacteria bacterium]|nr:nucleotidyltransferase domain-containing protein [Candidatus Magasanikbacteria bacterium]
MAKNTNPIIDRLLKSYLTEVAKDIHIDDVFLFGSAATNRMRTDSDIDVIIISKDFEHIPYMRRLQLLSRANLPLAQQVAIDSFGYTPEEFAEMDTVDSPILRQIKKEGYFI